jgi:hypothetical protein
MRLQVLYAPPNTLQCNIFDARHVSIYRLLAGALMEDCVPWLRSQQLVLTLLAAGSFVHALAAASYRFLEESSCFQLAAHYAGASQRQPSA